MFTEALDEERLIPPTGAFDPYTVGEGAFLRRTTMGHARSGKR
jgi:hypothetical protein